MRPVDQRGFTMIEMIVSLAVVLLVMTGVINMLLHNARLNKAEQMTVDVQTNARNCLDMIVPMVRTAGWDPTGVGIPPLVEDPDTTDGISQMEFLADSFDPPDGLTDNQEEHILIRHVANRVEWRRTPTSTFEVLATNISNDSDGNGSIEPLFTVSTDGDGNPTRVTVRITAEAPDPHPMSGEAIRYTVTSDVVLRTML